MKQRALGPGAPAVSVVGYGGMHLSIDGRPSEAQGIRVLRVLSLFRRQRPVLAPVLPAQPDPGDAAEAPVL